MSKRWIRHGLLLACAWVAVSSEPRMAAQETAQVGTAVAIDPYDIGGGNSHIVDYQGSVLGHTVSGAGCRPQFTVLCPTQTTGAAVPSTVRAGSRRVLIVSVVAEHR